jgi:hypothetical protein
VRNGFRTRVWRELPFSARRAIIGTIRTVDEIDEWIADVVRSIRRSPAWLFVAFVGTMGIVLTVLLFLSLTQELTAGHAGDKAPQPSVTQAAAPGGSGEEIDTRLALSEVPSSPAYAAEFAFTHRRTAPRVAARPSTEEWPGFDDSDIPRFDPQPRRTPRAPLPELPNDIEPLVEERNPPSSGEPDLRPRVEFVKHGTPRPARESLPETLTVRAEPPVLERTADWRLTPADADGWNHTVEHRAATAALPTAYLGEEGVDTQADAEDAFQDIHAWPNQADVGFRVELHTPERAAMSQAGHSSLVIRNIGAETIRRLLISEPIPPLDIVTDAMPSGAVRDGVLQREIARLRANREKTLSIDWFPNSPQARQHSAQVMAEVFVAASVDVAAAPLSGPLTRTSAEEIAIPVHPRRDPAPIEEPLPEIERRPVRRPPSVECRVQTEKSVRVSDVAHVAIQVRNTGESELHNVRIWADVPGELRHRHGSALEYSVGGLAPGESHQAMLSVLGEQVGRAVTNIRVVADEPVEAAATARLAVVESAPVPARPRATSPRRATPVYSPCWCPCGPQVTWAGPAF